MQTVFVFHRKPTTMRDARNARSYAFMTDRAAAIKTLADLIALRGADKVRARLNNAPAIN